MTALQPPSNSSYSLEALRPEEIRLAKGTETTPQQRAAFFTRTHPKLAPWLVPNWGWWFRVGFQSEIEPIVAIARDQIVGHAGTLPFSYRHGEKIGTAVWYLVFAVLPECQGAGLGKKLTEEWMRVCPNPITECNEKSISIFKKYGWEETFETRRLAFVATPARLAVHKPRSLQIALSLGQPFYKAWTKLAARSAPAIEPTAVGKTLQGLSGLFQPDPSAPLELLRDENWARWRVLESPFLHEYRLFRFESAVALVRGFVSERIRRLHVLYVNASTDREQSSLVRGIVRWACDGRADLIWAVARSNALVRSLRSNLPSEIGVRIAAFNQDKSLMNAFLNPGFQLQAIDTDIDLSHAEDPESQFPWN